MNIIVVGIGVPIRRSPGVLSNHHISIALRSG
jgi:hypothetical protein